MWFLAALKFFSGVVLKSYSFQTSQFKLFAKRAAPAIIRTPILNAPVQCTQLIGNSGKIGKLMKLVGKCPSEVPSDYKSDCLTAKVWNLTKD